MRARLDDVGAFDNDSSLALPSCYDDPRVRAAVTRIGKANKQQLASRHVVTRLRRAARKLPSSTRSAAAASVGAAAAETASYERCQSPPMPAPWLSLLLLLAFVQLVAAQGKQEPPEYLAYSVLGVSSLCCCCCYGAAPHRRSDKTERC